MRTAVFQLLRELLEGRCRRFAPAQLVRLVRPELGRITERRGVHVGCDVSRAHCGTRDGSGYWEMYCSTRETTTYLADLKAIGHAGCIAEPSLDPLGRSVERTCLSKEADRISSSARRASPTAQLRISAFRQRHTSLAALGSGREGLETVRVKEAAGWRSDTSLKTPRRRHSIRPGVVGGC